MFQLDIFFSDSCFNSTCVCFLIPIIQTATLTVFLDPDLTRDDEPVMIIRRFCSCIIVTVISFFLVKNFIFAEEFKNFSLLELFGFRQEGLFNAIIIPLFLQILLTLHLSWKALSRLWSLYSENQSLMSKVFNLVFIGNVIVLPLYEEFVFRSCLVPLLLQCHDVTTVMIISGFIFGCLHTQDILYLRLGVPLREVIESVTILFSLAFFFGAYFALLFIKTGHFVAPFIAHLYWNLIHADPEDILCFKKGFFFIQIPTIAVWYNLLPSLTDHLLYSNDVFLHYAQNVKF